MVVLFKELVVNWILPFVKLATVAISVPNFLH
jgi:hypothetical protein